MIIWLASYPKSGNTWVRFFLESLLHSKDNNLDINNTNIRQFPLRKDFADLKIDENNVKEFVSNCITCQYRINLDNSVKIFKTHNAFWKADNHAFTNEDNTQGVIHIVRDPRNVLSSVNNHFHHKSLEESKKFIFDDRKGIFNKSKIENKKIFTLPQVIGSWRTHYNSWKLIRKNYLLVKYEDLIEKPKLEFKRIANYLETLLKVKFTDDNISRAVELSNFDRLKKIEEKDGFIESVTNLETGKKETFFNLGPGNDWRNILDTNISNTISKKFKLEMEELGYI